MAPLDWTLLSGPLPVVLRVAAVICGGWLLVFTLRSSRPASVKFAELAGCALLAVLATMLLDHLARSVWTLWPDRLDLDIYLWITLILGAATLAVVRAVRAGGWVAGSLCWARR